MVFANRTTCLWVNPSQLTNEVRLHLDSVDLRAYSNFFTDLRTISNGDNALKTIWIESSASQAIYSAIPANKRLIASQSERTSMLNVVVDRFRFADRSNQSDQKSNRRTRNARFWSAR
jgi:hypothetical protein